MPLTLPQKPLNIAQGLIPTQDTFDTNSMANLGNATDGNPTTYAGTGTKTVGSSAPLGNIYLDLGSIKKGVLVTLKFGQWSTASSITTTIDGSSDNSTWIPQIYSPSITTTTEFIKNMGPLYLINTRYILINFNLNAAATGNIKLYELNVYEMG